MVNRASPNIAACSRAKHQTGCCDVPLAGEGQWWRKITSQDGWRAEAEIGRFHLGFPQQQGLSLHTAVGSSLILSRRTIPMMLLTSLSNVAASTQAIGLEEEGQRNFS